jgi:hypothetical protein
MPARRIGLLAKQPRKRRFTLFGLMVQKVRIAQHEIDVAQRPHFFKPRNRLRRLIQYEQTLPNQQRRLFEIRAIRRFSFSRRFQRRDRLLVFSLLVQRHTLLMRRRFGP